MALLRCLQRPVIPGPCVAWRDPSRTLLAAHGVYQFDPLGDPRWSEVVARHPHSLILRTIEWLNAIYRTYGYRPVIYTREPLGLIENGVALCEVSSCLTGRRLNSRCFSDPCESLVDDPADENARIR
jgi:hypothetical protein